jgi:lipoprotein-anchoring transpeptidase ErfK/SrfK
MRWSPLMACSTGCAALAGLTAVQPVSVRAQWQAGYRIETGAGRSASLRERFNESQLALLEKLNRADGGHLAQLKELVVPDFWSDDELSYSVLPARYAQSDGWSTFMVVYLPGQLFGAYEFGRLVRWGPVSSGSRRTPTSPGRFALNWRSTGRASTVDPDWFMRWYFNFGNQEGLAFHEHPLPGYPASHGCIRLLERDAEWLFEWGETSLLDPVGERLLTGGTPMLLLGRYDFDKRPPWRSLQWLSSPIELPSTEVTTTHSP